MTSDSADLAQGQQDSNPDGVRVAPASAEQLDSYRQAQQQLMAFATPLLYQGADPHARVFFALFDGTGNHALKDPAHLTNVGQLARQIDQLSAEQPHIGGYYKEGPGTQGGLGGLLDKANGGSFGVRVEAMYDKFAQQAARWIGADPLATISVIAIGFSRGAEQAAAFARAVDARGVARPGSKMVDTFLGQQQVYYNAPPLRAPGSVAQALGLYDPVGTGEPRRHDRRPPPSVLTGLQITAADEHRALFPVTSIIGQGVSADGRFLGVSTAGAHSDIGGGFQLNGLAHRNFNLMAGYLNGVLGEALIAPLALPAASATVVHDAAWYYHKLEGRKVVYKLEPSGKLQLEALNPVFAPVVSERSVHPWRGTAPPAAAPAAIVTLDTGSAAFDSIGRHQEIALVLEDAAARLRAGASAPFALQDTNGNDVGQFSMGAAAPHTPLAEGAVRIAFDLGKDAFSAAPMARVADLLDNAAARIDTLPGAADFPLLGPDASLLGMVAMGAPPLPEAQAAPLAAPSDPVPA